MVISIIICFDNAITPLAFDNDNISLKLMNHDISEPTLSENYKIAAEDLVETGSVITIDNNSRS